MTGAAPRVMISAAHKSSGKTVVTTALARALANRGEAVQPFKKGPDYIDPMWLSRAARRPCYNLDFNTMSAAELTALLASRSGPETFALVEANKGLYDGLSEDGSDSNAGLARLLALPVVLVIDTVGMTRGIAPLLLGYRQFGPDIRLAGVILNRTGGSRHESKLRAAVETHTDIPVLGAVGRDTRLEIGERHLGLTTPAEEEDALESRLDAMAEIIACGIDLDRLRAIARAAPPLARSRRAERADMATPGKTGKGLRIAIARDRAFGFYYADDLEAFAHAGATLIPFDTLRDPALPDDIDGLLIGGGFPELALEALSANVPLRRDIAARLAAGLPAYAECGGLMYLSRAIRWGDKRAEMVGHLPFETEMQDRPQGRGLTRFRVLDGHPWAPPGAECRAHEFHYARATDLPGDLPFKRQILRGHGTTGDRDGVLIGNTLAGFCHLRNSRQSPWVSGFLAHVSRCRRA